MNDLYLCEACQQMKSGSHFPDADENLCEVCYNDVMERRRAEYAQALNARATKHGFTPQQMEFIQSLERQIERLQAQLDA